ncbi:MAG: esterase family protein [Chitinophagales bacterium]|nr:esterase family protein [Chitinophagales bacterium]
MIEQYFKWHSPTLGRETEMLVFGDRGYPIIVFPTSMGHYYQNKDFKLLDAVQWYVNEGKVKIYCVDSVDNDSWYNKKVDPSVRAANHVVYDQFLRYEMAPQVLQDSWHSKLAVAGCSFGGYHAANFAFRYPEITGYLFSMSGAFDIKPQVNGYYDDNVFYNNPFDFLPELNNPALYQMGIVLGSGEHDICLPSNKKLSEILHNKNVPHWLDIVAGASHDWPLWREMFPRYLGEIK